MTHRASFLTSAVALVVAAFSACGHLAATDPSSAPDPSAPPPITVLAVSNVTTGGAFDPDGFSISIDGNTTVRLDLNETWTLQGIASAGSHTVVLSGLASNCRAVDGDRKRITVDEGTLAQVRFEVVCTPRRSSQGSASSSRAR